MRHRRKIVVSIVVLMLLIAVWHVRQVNAARAAEKDRAKREAVYAMTAEEWKAIIKPGMLRSDAEAALRNRSLDFVNRSGSGTYDDLVPLAREPSPQWYCSDEQVQVLLEFSPATAKPDQYPTAPTDYEARSNDRVKSVTLDHWLEDCL